MLQGQGNFSSKPPLQLLLLKGWFSKTDPKIHNLQVNIYLPEMWMFYICVHNTRQGAKHLRPMVSSDH